MLVGTELARGCSQVEAVSISVDKFDNLNPNVRNMQHFPIFKFFPICHIETVAAGHRLHCSGKVSKYLTWFERRDCASSFQICFDGTQGSVMERKVNGYRPEV